jgi:uncharacterized membrane protein YdbT with pleckstrin-like domain
VGYTEKNLIEGERLLYIARLHWIIFLSPVLVLLAGVILSRYLHIYTRYAGYAGYAIGAVGLFIALSTFSEYMGSEFGVTNKRIIVKVGIVSRTAREIFINRVESIQLKQTFIGRLLGFGSVIPAGTGGDKASLHNYIDNPMALKKAIDQQIIRVRIK